MSYFINLGSWGSIFAVPCDVVDKHLKIANPVHIKVLLYMLRCSGVLLDNEKIAKACRVGIEDVNDAVTYWVQAGIFAKQGNEIVPSAMEKPIRSSWEQPAQTASAPEIEQKEISSNSLNTIQKQKLAPSRPARPSHEECARLLAQSEELQGLVDGVQSALGRLLSRADIDVLISLNQWAGMPADVILIAVCHCVELGKANMRYIEKVVLGWLDDDIDTVGKADLHLKKLANRSSAWNLVVSVTGIDKRKPSEREAAYCEKWVCEWNFERDMIRLAYDTCVNSTGKLAFGYMNKILERWHTEGITNPQQLKAAVEAEKQSSDQGGKKRKSSYDLDELEKRLNSDFI